MKATSAGWSFAGLFFGDDCNGMREPLCLMRRFIGAGLGAVSLSLWNGETCLSTPEVHTRARTGTSILAVYQPGLSSRSLLRSKVSLDGSPPWRLLSAYPELMTGSTRGY